MADSVNITSGAIESLVRRLDADDLLRTRDRVKEVVQHIGFDALRTLIQDGIENGHERLRNGPIREQAQYARDLGFLAGLQVLLDLPNEIFRVAEKLEQRIEAAEDSAPERKA